MGDKIRYLLESPVSKKEARRRRLDQSLSKLEIFWPSDISKGNLLEELTKIVSVCKKQGGVIHVQSINSFVKLEDYIEPLVNAKSSFWFDSAYEKGARQRACCITIECDNSDDIRKALEVLDCEEVVFYPAKLGERDLLIENIYFRGMPPQYEFAYLPKILEVGLVVFYGPSHNALELLGEKEKIIDCFCFLAKRGLGERL